MFNTPPMFIPRTDGRVAAVHERELCPGIRLHRCDHVETGGVTSGPVKLFVGDDGGRILSWS